MRSRSLFRLYKTAVPYQFIQNMRFIILFLLLSGLDRTDARCQPRDRSALLQRSQRDQALHMLQLHSQKQQAQLLGTSLPRNIIFGGDILIFLLILIACREYQLKQRALRKVQTQQLALRRQNQIQQQLLGEKDLLLAQKDLYMKEIYHRVRNNLNIIISLLESQSKYLNNPTAQAALRDTQNRVHVVFLLHQKMYGATARTEVDVSLYITELIGHLSEMFDAKYNDIIITQKIDPVSMTTDAVKMLPLAFIINEIVTNAIKHAFPAGRKGRIHLLLNKDASGTVRLQVRDNGVGLPFHLRPDADHSLGLSLINGLVAQVHGSWTIEDDGGVIVTVQFPFHRPIKHSEKETIPVVV
jgi:two-component sensor histidine kinase